MVTNKFPFGQLKADENNQQYQKFQEKPDEFWKELDEDEDCPKLSDHLKKLL